MSVATSSRELSFREVNFGAESLNYFFGYSCGTSLVALLQDQFAAYSSVLMLIDSGARGHADLILAALTDGPPVVPIVVEPHERHKSLAQVNDLLGQAVAAGIRRDSAVMVMGGGVLGNIGGMVAALLYRGLPLVHLPTTPVAAFDSVLSAKQAVNLPYGKNLCGTFLTPSLIACDLAWLETVPHDLMTTGLVEMAKNVLAVRPPDYAVFVGALAELGTAPENALRALLGIGVGSKLPFLAIDPKERQEALIFEYGHTVGHALEFASAGSISHGEAVGWGMLAAADIAHEVCGLPDVDRQLHYELIAVLGLDRDRLRTVDARAVIRLLTTDNKRGYLHTGEDSVAMVLLESLGRPVTQGSRPLVGAPRSLVESAVLALGD